MSEADLIIPGPVVFSLLLFVGALAAAMCALFGSCAYAVFVWANHKWGKPK